MNKYVGRVKLLMGDVEKETYTVVEARSKRAAGKEMLLCECHFDPSWHDDDGSFERVWDGDMYVYTLVSVVELDDEQFEVLRQLELA